MKEGDVAVNESRRDALKKIMAGAAGVIPILGQASAAAGQGTPAKVAATNLIKRTVYHSPQTPGYTCWVGCWLMPAGKLMTSFHQATGPFKGRPRARKDVSRFFSWPPKGKPEFVNYDMSGLDMGVIHLLSNDNGREWERVGFEPAATPMNGWTCEPETVTADGTIFRAVWGQYLPFYDVPQTGYWQKSTDGAKSWSAPAPFWDETKWMSWPTRFRVLRDGRLAVSGAVFRPDPKALTVRDWIARFMSALWFSEDQGEHWTEPLVVWNRDDIRPSEESDFAELPNGDILVVIRADNSPFRWQALLRKEGKSWKPEPVRKLWIPYSGHPELLMTREGVVLHLATDGVAWTADEGEHWAYLEGRPRTGYYPRSLQLPDGRVFCVYHIGNDNYYGEVDQRIESITFELQIDG